MQRMGMVELQPSFQDHLQNLQIGILCRPSSQESYTLTIGYHELAGAKVPLKKPLLMLRKTKHRLSDDDDHSSRRSSAAELQVIGIIRHKISFKTRPKALISSGN